MNYITSVIASSILAKVTRPTMDKITVPIANIIKPVTNILTTPFKDCSVLKGLIYSSRVNYHQVGNSFLVLKNNSNSFIQYINYERAINFIGYLNNIIFTIINIVENIEDSELVYEYEYIYSLSDCIVDKEEHSSDFRLKEYGNDILLLSNLFDKLDDYNIERFLLKNQYKMLWDIKKALYGIHCNGYEYGKMEWSDIVVHNNNFKLVVSDELKQPLGNVDYDNDWINFIMLYNTGICNDENKIRDNRERQDLVQLLKRIDNEKSVINTISLLENTNIYTIQSSEDEINYLMSSIQD